jgi:serine/threonine-protein kinase
VADLIGKKLKDFYVLRRLGRGAMAEVFLAQQTSLGRQVALKVLDAGLARDPNYVRRFQNEARAAAALVHACIVQIYEVGEADGVHFIAQEYVSGRDLGEVIRGSGSLPPRLALDILRQVAAALNKAANEGIVHRDIKPENIILARTGEVKVADFGLARVQSDGAAGLTQVGVTMGTPLYMSPEQIEARPLDSRSDIYSLGVTAYYMLAGEPPFNGDSPLTVAVQHLNQLPVPLAARRPGIPPRLAQVVERMLAKKPQERFADPAALLSELQELAADGAREGWAAASDQSLLTDIIHIADQRAKATTRLEDLMKAATTESPNRSAARWLVAGVLGCMLLGAALAMLSRQDSMLAGAQAGPPRRESVWAQLYQAKTVDTEAAWIAARDYPGGTAYHQNLAKQGLVYHYLSRTQQYEKAMEPLGELADLTSQPLFQAFGIAGLVVVHAKLGDDEQAYNENMRLTPEMRVLLQEQSPSMAELLDESLDELANSSS